MMNIMVSSVEEVTGKRADMSRAVNAHHNFCQQLGSDLHPTCQCLKGAKKLFDIVWLVILACT